MIHLHSERHAGVLLGEDGIGRVGRAVGRDERPEDRDEIDDIYDIDDVADGDDDVNDDNDDIEDADRRPAGSWGCLHHGPVHRVHLRRRLKRYRC